ncbi:MAG: hypothetical protein RIQ79_703 [Verrucomicrobiota bacterium]
MITLPRSLLAGTAALSLVGAFCPATRCTAQTGAAPFTAQLTEIEDVQAIYSLRHPKLILADLDKLMAAVPEAGMLRMVLPQLTAYGYPEFSELAADTNIGVAMLKLTPEDITAGKPAFVGFAKLKEGGKIWTALIQAGLTLQKHDDWTWIAKDPAAFAKITHFATITARLDRPQTAELVAWGRSSPELLAKAKELILPELLGKLSTRPADEQKAFAAYADVLWSYLAQLHSVGGSLDLNDQGVTITYSGQFLPTAPPAPCYVTAPAPPRPSPNPCPPTASSA